MTTTRRLRGVVLLALAGLTLGAGTLATVQPRVSVLVQGGDRAALAAAVAHHGGTVTQELSIIDGVTASVPAGEVAALATEHGVDGVLADSPAEFDSVLSGTSYDPVTQAGSMYTTAQLVGAPTYWTNGYTGAGVDVALVDTGVAPSTFFGTRLVAGTDTSGTGNALSDGYGHGTHMAGIIAGSSGTVGGTQSFTGMAPGARVVSVKVADNTGSSSLLKILSGLDWIYSNRANSAYRIKVVNLSLSVPALTNYQNDPLSTAVEKLTNAGISVVAAVGNIGPGLGVTAPAYDPSVIAVGSLDTKGTVSGNDDTAAPFSAGAQSDSGRRPDIVAPGRSIQSVVAPGSVVATNTPASSKIGTNFVVGSGTSQSAAVVSGALALMYQEQPALNPASQKLRITNHSSQMGGADLRIVGWGKLNLSIVYRTTDAGSFSYAPASASITGVDAVADSAARAATLQGSTWSGSTWQGSTWSGSTWSGSTWSGSTWSASRWA